MERNTRMIKTLYGLSSIKYNPSQTQYNIFRFLRGDRPDYTTFNWSLPRSMESSMSDLSYYVDHPDFYKDEITFLPYTDLEDIQNIINTNVRWKVARRYGLKIRIEETHNEIFKNPQATCKYILIISCSNWRDLLKSIKKDLYIQWKNERKEINRMYIMNNV